MARPSRSRALLLGREEEIAQLYDALALAMKGEPQVVVVAGDAGLGKTTLVADLARRAEELGSHVAVGHCLDIEAGISFAPVIEALAALVDEAEVVESRPVARRIATFLDPESPMTTERLHLLDDLRLTILEAAASRPVTLVLEDLHWADRSTRDLASALSRTARGRLLIVLTVRTDDLHRRHPARKALAEIGRLPGGRRVELGPLDRAGIEGIIASVTGGPADPALVRSVLERSEGNPLYAEEIAAAGSGAMPDQLADLFLARVDALPRDARELARTASVDGMHLDLESLADLAGLDRDELDSRLRELVDANVLRGAGESLEFRHGLLREAVYDDLLPDERTRLHARLAAILQAKVDVQQEPTLSALSRLAFHWSAAHDSRAALVAFEKAGMVALKVGAAESVTHLERALSIWDSVPDAEVLAERTKIELVISLADAVLDQGDEKRWHALNRRAVDMLRTDTPPLVACRAHFSFAYSAMNVEDTASAPEAVRLALEYAGDTPTEERAYALGAQALIHVVNGRFAEALEAADRAVEAARAGGAVDALLLDLMFKSEALMYLGHPIESCAVAEQAVRVAREVGMLASALDHVKHLAYRLLDSGQVDRGMSLALAGRREGLSAGLDVPSAFCGEPLVTAHIWGGRLDQAEELLAEFGDLGLGHDPWWESRADLALARGDVETAARVVPRDAGGVSPRRPPPMEDEALRLFRIAALGDEEEECLATAASYLSVVGDNDSPVLAAAAARIGFQALTEVRRLSQFHGQVDGQFAVVLRESVRQLERARAGLFDEWWPTYYGVQLALAEGYAARVGGAPAIEEFRVAAELSGPFGEFFALQARLDLAQELLAHGGRDEGRELLVDCWTSAHHMGAHGLEQRGFGSQHARECRSRNQRPARGR